MITQVTGTIKSIMDQAIILDMNGLGLHVAVAQESIFHLNSSVTLFAYMHWNQEQGPSLYGFSSELEKAVFLMIIDCSGIGPKIGLAVLSSLGAERFIEIIQSADERALSKVSGIGPKKAEQMIVQLKHKVSKLFEKGYQVQSSTQITHWQNLQEVLESLHYSRAEISVAMRHLRDTQEPSLTFDNLMRKALTFLSKNK